jgi:L-aminopeptidase/D-esterase-like protein
MPIEQTMSIHINPSLPIPGLKIGHALHKQGRTGCTVFLCPPDTIASVDMRGPAPGSRETALLEIDKPVDRVNAVVLTGGSAFGLGTADGVMRYLAEHNIGHWTPIRPIPIVPAAVVYDLFMSEGEFPTAETGYAACLDAAENNLAQGNVGAGASVTVGKWAGFQYMMKGGFGLASWQREDLIVGAAVVVNAVGDVMNRDGTVLAGAREENGRWRVEEDPLRQFPERPPAQLTNTTLVVVATNARLNKIETNRLAQRSHDGLAIAIHPVHTTHDGDAAFAVATGQVTAVFDLIANAVVEVVAEAVRNGVRYAASVGKTPGLNKQV